MIFEGKRERSDMVRDGRRSVELRKPGTQPHATGHSMAEEQQRIKGAGSQVARRTRSVPRRKKRRMNTERGLWPSDDGEKMRGGPAGPKGEGGEDCQYTVLGVIGKEEQRTMGLRGRGEQREGIVKR